ncbi:MAG: hypothetical protein C4297_07335 [Gemmataceae bacterium]
MNAGGCVRDSGCVWLPDSADVGRAVSAWLADPALARLDFDQFIRYGAAAFLLEPWLRACADPSVLEVGCHTLDLLPLFLRDVAVRVVRCDVRRLSPSADFVVIPEQGLLPFATGQWDFVVALEVLEHVPPERRGPVLAEWFRVAKRGVLLSFPRASPCVVAAERTVRLAYERRQHEPHEFLEEHARFGCPDEDEIVRMCRLLDAQVCVFRTTPVREWAPLVLLAEDLYERAGPAVQAVWNRYVNAARAGLFTASEAYRTVLFCFKDRTAAAHAARVWNIQAFDSAAVYDPLPDVAAQLCSVYERQAARIRELEEELEKYRAAQVQAALLEQRVRHQQARISEQEQALSGRRLRRLMPRCAAVHQLLPDPSAPGRWQATGCDPYWAFEQRLPAGWACLELAMTVPPGVQPRLYYDDGSGFSEDKAIDLPAPTAPALHRLAVHFPRGIRGWRLDPTDRPGPVELYHVRLRPWHRLGRWVDRFLSEARRDGMRAACTRSLRWLARRLAEQCGHGPARAGRAGAGDTDAGTTTPPAYEEYVRAEAHWIPRRRIAADTSAPHLSVLLTVAPDDVSLLPETLASLQQQAYGSWEVLVALPQGDAWERQQRHACGLPVAHVCRMPPGFCEAEALQHLLEKARGDWIVPVAAGDRLAPYALHAVARALIEHPRADLLYSDEDRISANGRRHAPHFKPDWAYDYFLATAYVGRLLVLRRQLALEAGGFRAAWQGAHECDLLLRTIAADGSNIYHLPEILYHRWDGHADGSGSPESVARRLLYESRCRGWHWSVEPDPRRGTYRLRFPLPVGKGVSVVIPTAGRLVAPGEAFVTRCVASVRRSTAWSPLEIVVVDNGDLDPGTRAALDDLGVQRITYRGPAHVARKINAGADRARGDFLLLLNDDVEALHPGWLEALLEYAAQPGVGAVGARLVFPDGRLQHIGVHLYADGPGHPYYRAPGDVPGYRALTVTPRNCIAVTGACLLTPRHLFLELGGFSEQFPIHYNDVDYCLRLHARGYRIVYTPYAELVHHEGVSKGNGGTVSVQEQNQFRALWAHTTDPYYNPNLSLTHCDYRIKRMDELVAAMTDRRGAEERSACAQGDAASVQ